MSILFVSNFFRRVADYVLQNRRRLVKAMLITAAAAGSFALVYYGAEAIHRARSEKRINALEKQIDQKEGEIRERDAEAETLKRMLEQKQSEVQFLEARAKVAESALEAARRNVVPLKKAYEQARNNDVPLPLPTAFTSCSDLRPIVCADLAAAGHPCR